MSPSPQVAINSGPSEAEARATKVRGDLVTNLVTTLVLCVSCVHHTHCHPPWRQVLGDLATKLATSMQVLTSAPCPLAAGARRSRDETCDKHASAHLGAMSPWRQVLGDLATKLASGATDDASLLRAVKAAGGIERVVSLAKGNLDSLAVQVMTSLP